MTKLIFGCGYLGGRVAHRWLAAGDEVVAVTRSQQRADQLRSEGLVPFVADVTQPETLSGLPPAQTVLYAVGYDRSAEPSKAEVYVTGLEQVLAKLSQATEKLIYISSSSVYGQQDGQEVNEVSPCQPITEGGRICLQAEQLLQSHALFGNKSIILRLTGIYGPGRIPRQRALAAGEPIAVADQGLLNLIHVDDAVQAVLAAEARGQLGQLYLVSDGTPVRRADYYAEVARLVGGPPPRMIPPEPGAPVAERASSSKAVRNTRLIEDLQVTLRYPSYREGLPAALQAEKEENAGG